MASEIRVNKIENRSGLGTVTFADTGVDLAGIVTATTFSGSGASLTALPAASLTGTVADARFPATLPAISAANLTNVPAANVVGVHTSLTVTNATTTGTAVVGGGVTISESGIEASGIGITVANINGTQIGGRRNLIINGAMNVAQRGTSSTTVGYQTVDRMTSYSGGLDESPTYSQADVASGTTPYTNGFRKSFKIQNGNQTSGAGADDHIVFEYRIEDQDLATSGWNYTSATSYITMSFWVKSSVAQNFYFNLQSDNGSQYRYVMETGSLTANTWTKIIKTIPGNSNIVLNNDSGIGMYINWHLFDGTNRTGTRPLDAWAALDNASRTPDQTSTWYTTNDATFEFTGFQLEVGSQATAFEHRSFDEELSNCHRYFQTLTQGALGTGVVNGGGEASRVHIKLLRPMRAAPTVAITGTISFWDGTVTRTYNGFSGVYVVHNFAFDFDTSSSEATAGSAMTHGRACCLYSNVSSGGFTCSSEL